ncbi:MAG: hypothetical protein GAK43_02320 [Stenotrophomonas maltophilia]|nr:MAG: hypothetical protein GAK43_02320 [Stenotrophomonas maltophilia]
MILIHRHAGLSLAFRELSPCVRIDAIQRRRRSVLFAFTFSPPHARH